MGVGDVTVLEGRRDLRSMSSKQETSVEGDGEPHDIGNPESVDSDDKDDDLRDICRPNVEGGRSALELTRDNLPP